MSVHAAGMFTVKEINRLKILQDVIDRNLRPGQAADMLGITPRHCSRLLKRYRQSGAAWYEQPESRSYRKSPASRIID